MPHIEDDPLPDAYVRLMQAQRHVSDEERKEIERAAEAESLSRRIVRRLPKAY